MHLRHACFHEDYCTWSNTDLKLKMGWKNNSIIVACTHLVYNIEPMTILGGKMEKHRRQLVVYLLAIYNVFLTNIQF